MDEKEGRNTFFYQVCREAMSNLKSSGTGYVFSEEQYNEIKNNRDFNDVVIDRQEPGLIYLSLPGKHK